ncbi:glutamine-rich protein 2-like [Pluvialis apricaria]
MGEPFAAPQIGLHKSAAWKEMKAWQDEEVLKRIQATIVQVQGDHEKLSSVVGNLVHESHRQQKDTKALFQSLEKLAKEKAAKEDLLLAIDVKADKSVLAGKVSRSELDARMERLTQMVEEMLSRQTGQEKVQQQLSEEVASKLDRLELGPFRQQLEGHCKNILEQGKEKKEPEAAADDAAGIKSPLLTHFHCLSCDRPLDMRVPGPLTVAIPALPPLLPRLTEHPRTILKPEQEQQHGHREPLVEGRYPTVPRSCGGRHTVTTPLQRRQRLQTLLLPSKCNLTNLLGTDRPISKDRPDEKLPNCHFSVAPRPPQDRPSTRTATRAQLLFRK